MTEPITLPPIQITDTPVPYGGATVLTTAAHQLFAISAEGAR